MAASTADNPIVLSGNTNNLLYFYVSGNSITYDLSADYINNGLGLTAPPLSGN
jgi:hypothetical protein